ncbi:excinuclease ABC subunit UvrC [Candidatus Peregrinibacteria bacterium]|nr:excinuclease ABC subunit UvrC [Candidatus Peregrinibacteria bacterium]
MTEKNKIKKILENLPSAPGVYSMINKEGIVIYVGKAKDINKRVRQYFQKTPKSIKTSKMIENIDDIAYTVVDSELEAILLETNLIKQLQPKYNILMKDGKNYVYIKIFNEDFPRIKLVRKVEKDGAKYIGPKTSAHNVKALLSLLKKIFPYRHCDLQIESRKSGVKVKNKVIKYPCLDHFIKKCSAPCINKITKQEYAKIIKNIEDFLAGKADNLLKDLEEEMKKLAQQKKFEKAAKLRDKLIKIKEILEKQKISDPGRKDTDVINYCISRDRAYFNLFQIRDGKLINQDNFILKGAEMGEEEGIEALKAFVMQYYEIATDIPKEILLPHKIDDQKELAKWINAKVIIPKRGDKNKLLELSLSNARIYADRNKPSWQEESDDTKKALEELKEILKLKESPKRIECFDISHLSGTETVGSMIVFEKGVPNKGMYRKFRLRSVQGKPDDYKSMNEVLYRRFSKIAQEIKYQNYIFKKALKKYQNTIKPDKKEQYKDYYILEKKNGKKSSLAGYIRVISINKKVTELKNLYIEKKERGKKLGHLLIKKAIDKAKSKRVYILCKPELKDYYYQIGFEDIKKLPEELKTSENECKGKICNMPHPMVYDKNKYKKDESFSKIPDLVVVDGGKGQLKELSKVFKKLDLSIPHIALAKRLEEIYLPNSANSIILEKNNNALRLLQRARDEAHRFAISYNRKLRSKKIKQL